MSNSSDGVCINQSFQLLFLFNFFLKNNFDFALLLMNLLVLVYIADRSTLILHCNFSLTGKKSKLQQDHVLPIKFNCKLETNGNERSGCGMDFFTVKLKLHYKI